MPDAADAICTATKREWFSAAELEALALPAIPGTRRGIAMAADAQGWQTRRRQGRGGGVEYHIGSLPLATRAKLALEASFAARPAAEPRAAAKAVLSDEAAWAWYERQPETRQKQARERLEAVDAVAHLVAQGTLKVAAMQMIAAERDICLATLYGWEDLVRGVPKEHRLPRLAPRSAGREGMRAACDPDALAWLRSAWLSPSRRTVENCIRALRKVAPSKGWHALPSDRTLRRHIEAIDRPTSAFHRDGAEAADRLFPMLRRDRSALHALEMVNTDGHRFDVMVEWPDGTKGRPICIAFQDEYAGKILSWRVDLTENADAFRLAFGDLVEKFGIPDHVTVDNTLAAANKTMSGGVNRRFRFKRREEEPLGIFPLLGVEVHFTRPYSGQSKKIERAWGDFARDIARHPAFEGAYLGNSTTNKPHNHGARAVPLAQFLAVLTEMVADHNARPGRTAQNCQGRSFDATFDESYARSPIRRATPEQQRVWLLAVQDVTVRQDSTVTLLGNRYHHPQMVHHIGRPVVLRFDPDKLHAPVHLYRADGAFICTAECWEDAGFADTEAARRIATAKKLRRKGVKLVADAQKVFDAEELARDLAAVATAPTEVPERQVVRGLFHRRGNTALAADPMPQPGDLTAQREDAERRMMDAMRQHHGRAPALRVVSDDD